MLAYSPFSWVEDDIFSLGLLLEKRSEKGVPLASRMMNPDVAHRHLGIEVELHY